MPERKTVGQLMEEMRLKAGAQNYHGHEYMDLERFAEDTRHMIKILRLIRNDGLANQPECGIMELPQMSRPSERSA